MTEETSKEQLTQLDGVTTTALKSNQKNHANEKKVLDQRHISILKPILEDIAIKNSARKEEDLVNIQYVGLNGQPTSCTDEFRILKLEINPNWLSQDDKQKPNKLSQDDKQILIPLLANILKKIKD